MSQEGRNPEQVHDDGRLHPSHSHLGIEHEHEGSEQLSIGYGCYEFIQQQTSKLTHSLTHSLTNSLTS